ncbi:sigma 54-interacting transcriptional regulator [Sodalis sp.]|uniref:sigma 54-interacting transcriptional regulator n=1 Tax=Sodalis sp. (in: enterobacteria) TaxID=1898979 RepID=UPI003872A814
MRTRKHANLLLVDDDTSLLKLLGMRLTSEGFTVTTAENGPEALRQLLRNKIDLVISDLRMDEMDGIALFKAIQQQPGLPVIILTAHGAFTGAVSQREGLFQAADGGTLFLDEIGDMPLSLQVKLLRVLQERKVRPLGSDRAIDVRILSATHRDLPKAMAAGELREDLYYRLNVVSLKLPPLHERAEDIPLLAQHLLRMAAQRHKPFVRSFSSDAMRRLAAAGWPGNVRQLVNVIEQCVALTSTPVIGDALVAQALVDDTTVMPTFAEARHQFELRYLRKLLQITRGNVTQAARMAGRNRTEFYKLLSRHTLDPNDFKH